MIQRIAITTFLLFFVSACSYELEIDEKFEKEYAEIETTTQGVHHASGLAKIYADLAARGNTEAMVMLGSAYLYEEGVSFNPKKAMDLYHQAVNAGNYSAAEALSNVYAEGIRDDNGRIHLKPDPETSLMWTYVSMSQAEAGFLMEKLIDSALEESYKDSGVDFKRARARADEWLKEHGKG